MKEKLERFIAQIDDFSELSSGNKIDYFVYFLTEESGHNGATALEVGDCFDNLAYKRYSNIYKYLNDGIKGVNPSYVKIKGRYYLEKTRKDEIGKLIDVDKYKVLAKKSLRNLSSELVNPNEINYLKEAIKCFENETYRASIIMVWILTIEHLYEYVLKHKLIEFNSELAKVKDKKVKIGMVKSTENFSEIPEQKFIDICRASNILTNDTRKILEIKLGIRNSAAHPSKIEFKDSKVIDFIEDLVTNIINKYKI